MAEQPADDPDAATDQTGAEDDEDSPPPLAPVPQELLDKLPQEARTTIEGFFAAAAAGPYHPIFQRVNSRHVTQLLGMQERDNEAAYRDRTHSRNWTGAIVLGALATIVLLVFVLAAYNHTDVLTELIKDLVLGGGGLGGGYAIGTRRRPG